MTTALLLLSRLALAAVFATAAWTKLTDYPRWRQSLDQHDLGPALSSAVAALIPLAELAVAAGLIASPTTWTAALTALTLLTTFTAVTLHTLATGRAARCACFGKWGRLGSRTLARNALLAVPAVVLVVGG